MNETTIEENSTMTGRIAPILLEQSAASLPEPFTFTISLMRLQQKVQRDMHFKTVLHLYYHLVFILIFRSLNGYGNR